MGSVKPWLDVAASITAAARSRRAAAAAAAAAAIAANAGGHTRPLAVKSPGNCLIDAPLQHLARQTGQERESMSTFLT
jgi:hypothetical protein